MAKKPANKKQLDKELLDNGFGETAHSLRVEARYRDESLKAQKRLNALTMGILAMTTIIALAAISDAIAGLLPIVGGHTIKAQDLYSIIRESIQNFCQPAK